MVTLVALIDDTVTGLSELDVPGVVREIALLADTLGGDVVYRVMVELEEQPEGLRAGMSAEVGF
jgi:hypothetical protein